MTFVNISGYKFLVLDNLKELQQQFKTHCIAVGVKGTILLSHEGININLAGSESAVPAFVSILQADERFNDIAFKVSFSEKPAFKRLYVKIKPEIITTGMSHLQPMSDEKYRLPPQKLKEWLDDQKDFILLDTRNDYEASIGTFTKALTLPIEEFHEFFLKIQDLPEEVKNKPVVIFCTGGIRCEKALPEMLRAGFTEVYQLEGGIINYFTQCGDVHYTGTCFVFDDRGSVSPAHLSCLAD